MAETGENFTVVARALADDMEDGRVRSPLRVTDPYSVLW
jgi:hypothetical protein